MGVTLVVAPGATVVVLAVATLEPERVKLRVLDVPPDPTAVIGIETRLPVAGRSSASMRAVTRVAPTRVVGRGLPFQWTAVSPSKFEPSTVRVKAGSPGLAVAGLRAVSRGAVG